ncbi:MAG TPA: cytochrome c biogenesis protein CcdA, partial [Clostridiaceae bacterium]|nr:cytochrome c biogenesis protein CcdA [Clostridiaceae bacterium]
MTFYSSILTFIEGILTFISPCILPLIPVYVFYLAGAPDDGSRLSEDKHKYTLVINSLGFVAGFTLVFVMLGAAATSIGRLLKENQEILRKVSGIVIVIFGLSFLDVVKPGFLNKEKRFDYKFDKLGFVSSILFGAVFGFGWTPCVGPFLFTALS